MRTPELRNDNSLQAFGKRVVVERDVRENLRARLKRSVVPLFGGIADRHHWRLRLTETIFCRCIYRRAEYFKFQ